MCDVHPDFYDENDRVARKDHWCAECRRTIHKGRRYVEIKGKWDGDVQTHRLHNGCKDAMDHAASCFSDCVSIGMVREEMNECWTYEEQKLDEDTRAIRSALAAGIRESRNPRTVSKHCKGDSVK